MSGNNQTKIDTFFNPKPQKRYIPSDSNGTNSEFSNPSAGSVPVRSPNQNSNN